MAEEEAKVGASTMEFYRTCLPAVPLLLVGFLCGEGIELVRSRPLSLMLYHLQQARCICNLDLLYNGIPRHYLCRGRGPTVPQAFIGDCCCCKPSRCPAGKRRHFTGPKSKVPGANTESCLSSSTTFGMCLLALLLAVDVTALSSGHHASMHDARGLQLLL